MKNKREIIICLYLFITISFPILILAKIKPPYFSNNHINSGRCFNINQKDETIVTNNRKGYLNLEAFTNKIFLVNIKAYHFDWNNNFINNK